MPPRIAVTLVDGDGEIDLAQPGRDRPRKLDLPACHVTRVQKLGNQRAGLAEELPHGFIGPQMPQPAMQNSCRAAGGPPPAVCPVYDDHPITQIGNKSCRASEWTKG